MPDNFRGLIALKCPTPRALLVAPDRLELSLQAYETRVGTCRVAIIGGRLWNRTTPG